MKIMISQPMKGKTKEQINAEREAIVKQLESEGHEVLDTVFADSPEEAQNKPLWYSSKSVEAMSKVDAMYFMKGWNEARWCKFEHQIAEVYGIKILAD